MRWLDGITDSMDMGLCGLHQLVMGRKGVLVVLDRHLGLVDPVPRAANLWVTSGTLKQ